MYKKYSSRGIVQWCLNSCIVRITLEEKPSFFTTRFVLVHLVSKVPVFRICHHEFKVCLCEMGPPVIIKHRKVIFHTKHAQKS